MLLFAIVPIMPASLSSCLVEQVRTLTVHAFQATRPWLLEQAVRVVTCCEIMELLECGCESAKLEMIGFEM